MKKIIILLSIFLFIPFTSFTAFAESYFTIGGGSGGEADATNVTLELGRISIGRDYNNLLSIGLGFIFNTDGIPSDTLEYPVPHNDYTYLGTRQKGNEYAIFGKYGLEVIKNKRVFVFALGGFSFSEEVGLAQSNVTGWYYEQSSSSKLNGMFGGGLSYFPWSNKISFQVEYDNRRGITVGIGFRL